MSALEAMRGNAAPASLAAPALTAWLQGLEARHDLLRYTLDGWSVWPLFRLGIGWRRHAPASSKVRENRGWRGAARQAVADLAAWPQIGRGEYLALTYASRRLEQVDGRYRDVFVDDLLLRLPRALKLEHVDNPAFLGARRNALVHDVSTTTALKAVAERLARWAPPPAAREVAAALAGVLADELGEQAPAEQAILTSLARFHWERRLYRRVLSRVRPRVLFILVPYADHAPVAAARELGIEVVELQHGVVDRHHFGYSWAASSRKYRQQMALPDRVWLYGNFWRAEMAAWGFWGDELRVVGSPRMDRFRGRNSRPGEYGLVVTTQGIHTSELIAFLQAYLREAPDDPRPLTLRLHPLERNATEYESAFAADRRVRIMPASSPPSTFELIAGADAHASISSTCHYEALGLGIPTAVLPFVSSERLQPLCDSGHATLTRTPAELRAFLRTPPAVRAPADEYFAPGAVERMLADLKR